MDKNNNQQLVQGFSPFNVWAFALGTSIGWGSLVVTSSTYLAQAGPGGSVAGLVIGAAVMLLICRNYSYLLQIHPECGGSYAYIRNVFGSDYGFLGGWFLSLTYLAMLWANATSIPLFMRNFVGNMFEFGRLYSVFGYDVYLGEILLTISAIILFAWVCIYRPAMSIRLMTFMVCLFTVGISIVFFASLIGLNVSVSPSFVPDVSALSQIIQIAVISPWAFIGFESISHGAEEFSFKKTKVFRILLVAIIVTTILYIFVTLLSITAYPSRYSSWLEYIRDRGNLSGLEALPAFYAADHYMGGTGVLILMASLLALIITSLIGNISALSRLFFAQARDRILPECFAKLNRHGVPANAVLLIAGISLAIPFAGRTAIGWIVDVTTIGATLVYGFVSAAALKTARGRRDKIEIITGMTGLIIMIGFGLYLLLPSLVLAGSLEKETYFLFIVWSILGFLFFRFILKRDHERRFGTSAVVWTVLLSLVLFVALIWMRQSMMDSNDQMMNNIRSYYGQFEPEARAQDEVFIENQFDLLEKSNVKAVMMSVGMFAFALLVMLTNHRALNRRTRESETLANIDPMTGVKSKHAYLIREKEINAALESGRPEPFAIAVCDVNGLKIINDTLGHQAGDEYICNASKMVCTVFDHSPVYRIGGDEFVVILTGTDYDRRKELMHSLHDLSVSHITTHDVVVSGGMSHYHTGDKSFHDVFERADAKMYKEKQLLKSMGAVTRDEIENNLPAESSGSAILNIRKRILIAEDVEINQMMLGSILEEDYDLLYALDGIHTMETLQDEKDEISLVLLDLKMPGMDGIDILRIMKSDPTLRNIPVIVLTGDQGAEVECLQLGATDFIPKPYPGAEIIRARVSRSIELSETRDIIQSTERDALTKLFNIDYFIRYVETFDHHYENMPMDAIVIDVNQFQMINERYGREYANGILTRLGERIRYTAREVGGVCCRQGSDIFYLYCPRQDNYEDLLKKWSIGIGGDDESSEQVRLRIGVYQNVDKSIGIERRFDRAKKAADFIRDSRIKSIGFYDASIHEIQLYRDRLLSDFHPSLSGNDFKVYFQPKYNIMGETPVLVSAEALVRWVHPEFGMISPTEFIPILEESGLILELDRFVWEQTAKQIYSWKKEMGNAVPVSVNVSRIDMLEPGLLEILKEILQVNSLDTSDMILEITESAYTENAKSVIAMASNLRHAGFRIEMDDFGTGYSSLGMLNQLPIDALKLDMSFVRTAFSGEKQDMRIIELILDIARHLSVPVIAEGVETSEQLAALKKLRCEMAQGYYFSKPVPKEEFVSFFNR